MNKQTNTIVQQLSKFLIPTILFMICCFYCSSTPIEKHFNLLIPSWTKYLIAIPFILLLTIATKWTQKKLNRKIVLGLTVLTLILSRNINDRVFLGNKIAYTYLGQDAGFTELYLFDSKKCKITYGGILGVTKNNYGTFNINDSTIFINTKSALLDLEGQTIEVGDRSLRIQKL